MTHYQILVAEAEVAARMLGVIRQDLDQLRQDPQFPPEMGDPYPPGRWHVDDLKVFADAVRARRGKRKERQPRHLGVGKAG